MYTAMKIAEYIIKKSIQIEKPIDNLKLQKLLYYIQGTSLCNKKEKMFKDEIISYMYGPVVKEVYENYRHNVAANIYYVESIESNDNVENIGEIDMKIIDFVISKFENTTSWELVEKTHNENPWLTTKLGEEITLSKLENFFLNNAEYKI